MTVQEFRHLTEHHTNHEDKLQIKSIIYHSVKVRDRLLPFFKDSVTRLSHMVRYRVIDVLYSYFYHSNVSSLVQEEF